MRHQDMLAEVLPTSSSLLMSFFCRSCLTLWLLSSLCTMVGAIPKPFCFCHDNVSACTIGALDRPCLFRHPHFAGCAGGTGRAPSSGMFLACGAQCKSRGSALCSEVRTPGAAEGYWRPRRSLQQTRCYGQDILIAELQWTPMHLWAAHCHTSC
jgi:hypothetical protein